MHRCSEIACLRHSGSCYRFQEVNHTSVLIKVCEHIKLLSNIRSVQDSQGYYLLCFNLLICSSYRNFPTNSMLDPVHDTCPNLYFKSSYSGVHTEITSIQNVPKSKQVLFNSVCH